MKSYNEKIVQHILHYLDQAQHRIWVNVPWFTHKELFQKLLGKATQGKAIQLIIQDDDINSQTSFRHEDLENFGGRVFRYRPTDSSTGINHEKYCLIDDKYIIYGSFNWTYNADQNNLESILVGEKPTDDELIKQFENRFTEVLARFFSAQASPEVSLPADVSYIQKMEILLLQNECSWLEAEIYEIETAFKSITDYMHLHVGELILEKLKLEMLLEEKKADRFKKKMYYESLNLKKETYEHFKRMSMNDQARIAEIDQELKVNKSEEIKKIYREIVKRIHPDKFVHDNALYQKANKLMTRVNQAYENNNLDELSEILSLIENGTFADEDIFKAYYAPPELDKMLHFWKSRQNELLEKLTRLKNQDYFAIFNKQMSLDELLVELKLKLESDIETLNENLKHYP
jgi:hypothetical protein